ncbi:hypothetical protein [Methylovirgula sp. 4M-Z18]|uniref:hypothetical protein n=1 Tax=Methylovirgula sp. 4M-Z18 TaxID=2293567 RepID=UPI000E2F64AE|nr:hypothetical protein [Methylovirgula sp. 4M-Z18]RFB75557.1 hypothetical protein DYH55_22095 [Methylovirgula sp. 4M-Z18]
MRLVIADIDGALPRQAPIASLITSGSAERIDLTDLAPSLRLVASKSAMREFLRRIGPRAASSDCEVFFYGSGDFHHLTAGLVSRVSEPLTILHFDNHPDWVRFPRTMNCGAWVNRALELPQVQKVVTIGPASDDLVRPQWKTANLRAIRDNRLEVHAWRAPPTKLWGKPLDAPGVATHDGRLVWRNLQDQDWATAFDDILARLPAGAVWVTIDKDVLGPEEAYTNWDQGAMPLALVLDALKRTAARRRIVGVDICGDYSKPKFRDPFRAFLSLTDRARVPEPGAQDMARNAWANDAILKTLGLLVGRSHDRATAVTEGGRQKGMEGGAPRSARSGTQAEAARTRAFPQSASLAAKAFAPPRPVKEEMRPI